MTAAELIAALVDSLATLYPARTAAISNRPGRVTCVVQPSGAEYDVIACAPSPIMLTVDIHILAAGSDEQAVVDLTTHVDAVAGLTRAAGFAPIAWRAGTTNNDLPEIVLTAVCDGKG